MQAATATTEFSDKALAIASAIDTFDLNNPDASPDDLFQFLGDKFPDATLPDLQGSTTRPPIIRPA